MATRRPTETEFTDQMRMYTDDIHGNRVLAGLTPSETDEFEAIRARELADLQDESPYASLAKRVADRERALELHDKHEFTRIQIIAAEVQARQNPTRN